MEHYYFIAISIIGLIGGSAFFISRIKLHISGVILLGRVKKKQKTTWLQSGSGGHAELLVINYVDNDGVQKTFKEQNSIPSFFFNEGDNIKLIQDPHKPERIMVHSITVIYLAPIILVLLSGVAGYVGLSNL